MRSPRSDAQSSPAFGPYAGPIILGLWGVSVLIGLALIGALLVRPGRPAINAPLATTASPLPTESLSVTAVVRPPAAQLWVSPTRTVSPTPTLLPSRTPSPTTAFTHTPKPTRTPRRTATAMLSGLASADAPPIVIGYSAEGRPLEVYRFGEGPVKRLIVAGIHGGYEWNTVALADELIAHLNQHPEVIPGDVTLYLLRALNPDGYARAPTVDGRVNANGVDLNRNWPSHWQADWPRAGCWVYRPVTGGAGPASEPETQALMAFLFESEVDALISYHSAALGIFPGGQPPDPDSVRLAEAVAAVSDYPYPPIDTGCQFTGQLIDWASDTGLAALDVELTNHRDTDFAQNLAILDVFLAWRR